MEGAGLGGAHPPFIFLGEKVGFGLVWGVCLGFGGVFRLLGGLVCY